MLCRVGLALRMSPNPDIQSLKNFANTTDIGVSWGRSDTVKTCFRKYVTFSGRATRPEFWWF